jgi:osmotically inducible lipoprotein OsmB
MKGNKTMKTTLIRYLAVGTCVLSLSACSGMTSTEQRMLSGAGIGAGVGAVGTSMTGGCVSCGAVIGGAVGAGGGYLYDRARKK